MACLPNVSKIGMKILFFFDQNETLTTRSRDLYIFEPLTYKNIAILNFPEYSGIIKMMVTIM